MTFYSSTSFMARLLATFYIFQTKIKNIVFNRKTVNQNHSIDVNVHHKIIDKKKKVHESLD